MENNTVKSTESTSKITETSRNALRNAGFTTQGMIPKRYIPDINMTNAPSKLVVKNWLHALAKLPSSVRQSLATENDFKRLLEKYV